jgi:hypothetical protein
VRLSWLIRQQKNAQGGHNLSPWWLSIDLRDAPGGKADGRCGDDLPKRPAIGKMSRTIARRNCRRNFSSKVAGKSADLPEIPQFCGRLSCELIGTRW